MMTDRMPDDVELLKKALSKLLVKVNAVTAYHRHGHIVPERRLTELANRQIEVEEMIGLL